MCDRSELLRLEEGEFIGSPVSQNNPTDNACPELGWLLSPTTNVLSFLPPPGQISTANAHQAIDALLAKHAEYMRLLSSLRNEQLPVYTLPVEVLSRIFTLYQYNTPRLDLDWIKISHVSRKWRGVAIQSSLLWTDISFDLPIFWIQEMLSRSQTAPLNLEVDLRNVKLPSGDQSSPRWSLLQLILRQHMYRMEEITLHHVTSSRLKALCHDIPPSNAPRLRIFHLDSVKYRLQHGSTSVPDDPISLFQPILISTPYLRRVELPSCPPWASPMLTDLTHLAIHDLPGSVRVSTLKFLQAIQRMVGLEELHLEWTAPVSEDDSVPFQIPYQVDLPYLRFLNVRDDALAIAHVLGCLHIPPTTRLHLTSDITPRNHSGLLGILSFLNKFHTQSLLPAIIQPLPTIRALQIHGHCTSSGERELRWETWQESVDIYDEHGKPTYDQRSASIVLTLKWPRSLITEDRQPKIRDLGDSLPLHDLRALSLRGFMESEDLESESEVLIDVFGALPLLQAIKVEGDSSLAFIRTLLESARESNGVTRPFSALRTLWLKDGIFSEDALGTEDPVERLAESLKATTLDVLDIQEASHLAKDDVDLLREVVSCVVWDGRELGFDDDQDGHEHDVGHMDEHQAHRVVCGTCGKFLPMG